MVSIDRLKKHLIRKEGKELEAYKLEGEEYFTIGYGHNGPDVKEGMIITDEKAEAFLEKDLESKLKLIEKKLPSFNDYSENLQMFVVDGFFRGDLSGSPKTLDLLKQGNFEEASKEFLDHNEYKAAVKSGSGVASRMEDISEAIKNETTQTERMLNEGRTPDSTLEVDPGDEENPRTFRDLPPQAITPRERNLTGVAVTPIKNNSQAMVINEESPGKFRDIPPQVESPKDRTLIPTEEDMESTSTGDDIISNFFSGLIDFNSDDSDEVFEADELDAELSSDQDYQNLRRGGEVEANFVDDNKENDKADPPPGATPEEVADDIPAMLSEGEYVLPANVVRYIGLERITDMHKGVLHEIQQMEDLGIIQNVDEDGKPENDDDEMTFIEPKEDMMKGTMIIASKPDDGLMCPPGFASGGEINRNVEINRDINISNLRDTIATQRNDNKEMVETYDKDLGLIKYSIDGDPLAIMSPYFLNDYIKLSSLDSDHDQFGQDVADMEAAQKDKDQMSEAAEVSQNDMDEAAAAAEKEAAIGMDDDAHSQATAEAEAAEAGAGSETGAAAMGGLMNRKGYAVGGEVNSGGVNYNIAGVGQVGGNLTQSAVNQIKDTIEKPRTYEQIKAGTFNDTPEFDESLYNYGDKGEQILDSKQKTKKEKRELVVPDLNAGSPENPKFKDTELETILRMTGVDQENWTSMMYDFQHDQLGNNYGGAGVGNGSSLHALSTKRKLFKDGVKDTDIPEGSTNRDMLKSVFFNMIDDFGYDDPTGGYERQSNAPSQIEKLVKADPQTIYDNKEYSDTYKEAIKYLDLDGAADPTVLTHALNQMDTKGDGYNSAPRKTLPRSLMGSNTYVEGVGYVN